MPRRSEAVERVMLLHGERSAAGLCIYDARDLGRPKHGPLYKGGRCFECYDRFSESRQRRKILGTTDLRTRAARRAQALIVSWRISVPKAGTVSVVCPHDTALGSLAADRAAALACDLREKDVPPTFTFASDAERTAFARRLELAAAFAARLAAGAST